LLNQPCITRINQNWICILSFLYMLNLFAQILSRIFISVFMKHPNLYFCFLTMLSLGFTRIRVILVSENELGSVPSFSIFCKSLGILCLFKFLCEDTLTWEMFYSCVFFKRISSIILISLIEIINIIYSFFSELSCLYIYIIQISCLYISKKKLSRVRHDGLCL
jgi:hypothetical protein